MQIIHQDENGTLREDENTIEFYAPGVGTIIMNKHTNAYRTIWEENEDEEREAEQRMEREQLSQAY